MAELTWNQNGHRLYETGVGMAVLYVPNENGDYINAYPWNGVSSITETTTGAEVTTLWADNKKYDVLVSAEEFGGTIEAYTFPDSFLFSDGAVRIHTALAVRQQRRRIFGLSYVTIVGNDAMGVDYGYKLHLVWGALASPSERAHATISDSPEPLTFSWEFTTSTSKIEGFNLRPTSHIVIDAKKVNGFNLEILQDVLYGSPTTNPVLPTPQQVLELLTASSIEIIDGGTPFLAGPDILDGGTSGSAGSPPIDGGEHDQVGIDEVLAGIPGL